MRKLKKTNWKLGFVLILAVCNLHLLIGTDPAALIFDPAKVAQGQWWRIMTHPFVHVSWYHLLLDAAAVTLLWRELRFSSNLLKTFAAVCCAGASLLFALLASNQVAAYGLCGFSGTAHGLAVALGLNWAVESRGHHGSRRFLFFAAGLLLVLATAVKSLLEFITGTVFLSQMHMGELGVPIVASHLGGVLGGVVCSILAALLLLTREKNIWPGVARAR